MWQYKREHCGKGECHFCYEEKELYTYDFIDYLLCEECIKTITYEDWNIDWESWYPNKKLTLDKS